MKKSFCDIILFLSFPICFLSCKNNDNYTDVLDKFYKSKIQIHQDDFVLEEYSMFPDSLEPNLRIVHIFDYSDCVDCAGNAIYVTEQMNTEKKNQYKVRDVFFIMSRTNLLTQLRRELCIKRVKSKTYIDTCNAFLDANPQIPDNEMFHTFVINKDGKVLMVGNPFANEKMEALFKKVIAKERKKHKEIKKSV